MLAFFIKLDRHFMQRGVGLLLLMSLCLAQVPLPGPAGDVVDKDRTAPFPCQDHPCGCRSAKQCWKNCCCFSNKQKLAWAETHGVSPPDFVVIAATQEADRPRRTTENRLCCHQHKTCCYSARKTGSSKFVIGIAAEQCQGHHGTVGAIPLAVLPHPQASFAPSAFVTGLSFEASKSWNEQSLEPPVPPPRV